MLTARNFKRPSLVVRCFGFYDYISIMLVHLLILKLTVGKDIADCECREFKVRKMKLVGQMYEHPAASKARSSTERCIKTTPC